MRDFDFNQNHYLFTYFVYAFNDIYSETTVCNVEAQMTISCSITTKISDAGSNCVHGCT